jgi:glutathione S-transferase
MQVMILMILPHPRRYVRRFTAYRADPDRFASGTFRGSIVSLFPLQTAGEAMRLGDPRILHALILYLLPVLVAWLGWGVGTALVAVLLVAIVGAALRLRVAMTPASARPRLHTISYSHYVEKVRWCLDRAQIDYEEVPSIGILGVLLLGRTVPVLELPASRTSVGNSTEILRLLWGLHGHDAPGSAAFLEPTAEAVALEKHFDRALGESVRRWAYQQLFRDSRLTLQSWGAHEPAVPAWQRALLHPLRPLLKAAVRRMLRINEASAARALEKTRAVFDEVDARLADGRRYLLGDSLSFADITFASLGALAVLPGNYGGPALATHFPQVESLPSPWREEVLAFRQRPAGEFILRMYREERAGGKPGP